VNPLRIAARGQRVALRLMTDRCVVYRLDYDHPTPGTGGRDGYGRTDLYTGRCRIRPVSESRVSGKPAEAGGSVLAIEQYLVSVPLSVTGVEAHDLLQVTVSADPRLVGRVLKVGGLVAGSQVSARRMICEDNSP